jgi:hypothetical protein
MGNPVTCAFPHLREPAQAQRSRQSRHRLNASDRYDPHMALSPHTKKSNLRLALILASVVAVFFLGFVLKMTVLGG